MATHIFKAIRPGDILHTSPTQWGPDGQTVWTGRTHTPLTQPVRMRITDIEVSPTRPHTARITGQPIGHRDQDLKTPPRTLRVLPAGIRALIRPGTNARWPGLGDHSGHVGIGHAHSLALDALTYYFNDHAAAATALYQWLRALADQHGHHLTITGDPAAATKCSTVIDDHLIRIEPAPDDNRVYPYQTPTCQAVNGVATAIRTPIPVITSLIRLAHTPVWPITP